jgi:hypothetical protein
VSPEKETPKEKPRFNPEEEPETEDGLTIEEPGPEPTEQDDLDQQRASWEGMPE